MRLYGFTHIFNMADLTELQSSSTVKIIGSDATGIETNPVNANSSGRLLVAADLSSGQLVPTITNKLRIRSNVGDISISTTYVTMFSRSGTGLFFGFQAGFDNADIQMRFTVDGGQVFELLLDDIRQFQFNDTSTGRTQMGGFLTTIGNVLDFSLKYAIPYATSVLVEMKAVSGTKKNKNWIVFLTEDT